MQQAFICEAIRSPIGRYGGALSKVRTDDLAAHTIKALLTLCPKLPGKAIDEVMLGCTNQAGEDNRNIGRMAALLAGLPFTVPGNTINRLCGSSMDAIGLAARTIMTSEAELIIAGGVENMSRAPLVIPKAETAFARQNTIFDSTIGWRFINKKMAEQYGTESMPETAENLAEEYNISRLDQDQFARRSQEKYQDAFEKGRFAVEITPIEIPQRKGPPTIVNKDEHPRLSSLKKLASLPTPFRDDGTVTAGNASGVNDGAAALIIASEKAIEKYDLNPKARIVAMATAGVEPRIMGIGPVPATEKLMARLNLKISDFDLIELNEAFSAQALAVLRTLGLPDDGDHINPNGGAIALGHPLGMTGARICLTAATELQKQDLKHALCTMCIGIGQGISMVLEKV